MPGKRRNEIRVTLRADPFNSLFASLLDCASPGAWCTPELPKLCAPSFPLTSEGMCCTVSGYSSNSWQVVGQNLKAVSISFKEGAEGAEWRFSAGSLKWNALSELQNGKALSHFGHAQKGQKSSPLYYFKVRTFRLAFYEPLDGITSQVSNLRQPNRNSGTVLCKVEWSHLCQRVVIPCHIDALANI